MTFYDRYAECCARKGILPVSQEAAEQLGCSRAGISSFAKSGVTPKGDIVARAAAMLDVSADYLLGLIEYPRPLNSSPDVSHEDAQALELLRSLNEEGVAAALAMLYGLSDQVIYKKCGESELASEKNA